MVAPSDTVRPLTALANARVLITGGAGFIGSHIADLALGAGAERVVVLDDLTRGVRENLADARSDGRLELVVGDIRNRELVRELTAGVDLVFHQAALRITRSAEVPREAVEVMINGTQNVLDAAVEHHVDRVLAASSASVYGEPSYLPMDEAHPFNNRTVYGAAKIANEQLLRAYAEMHGLRYLALRPFNVYGPRMDLFGAYTEVMIRWLDRLAMGQPPIIFGDGTQTMDFVYVGDVARAYVLAAASDQTDLAINVGSGTETSLLELCRLLCRIAGAGRVEPAFQPARTVNAVSRRRASTQRAADILGFTATVPLEQGLRALTEWHAARSPAKATTA